VVSTQTTRVPVINLLEMSRTAFSVNSSASYPRVYWRNGAINFRVKYYNVTFVKRAILLTISSPSCRVVNAESKGFGTFDGYFLGIHDNDFTVRALHEPVEDLKLTSANAVRMNGRYARVAYLRDRYIITGIEYTIIMRYTK